MKNLDKIVNMIAITLIAMLGVAVFMSLNSTAESNRVTVDVAKIQSENKSRVLKEVALLTAEIKNLQKDMDKILSSLKEIESKKTRKND